ncbi:MAG TPA: L,D-transpeptidase family protein [Pseudolabrys sp.]|nr:L,D-transpeptidase family protein [Pseudolabrys sp.]
MERVRFNRLLASTALGLVLVFASHPGMAQQADRQGIDAAVPLPDTTLPPPLTAKDIESPAPAPAAAAEAAPAPSAPAQAEAAPAAPAAPAQTASEPAPAPAKGEAMKAEAPAPAPAAEPKQDVAAPAVPPAPAPKQDAAAPTAAPAPKQDVAAPVVPPTPAPVVAAAPGVPDQAVSDKLRELVTAKNLERTVGRKADRGGIEAFYAGRNYAPLWVANGAADARAKSAIAYLGDAEAVGLDSSDYSTPHFGTDMSADALAAAELKLTAAALTFARDAQIGRIHFTRVSSDIDFKLVAPEPAAVLAKLAGSDDAAKVLDSFNPPQPEFKALRAALADLRKNGDAPAKTEAEKPSPVKIADGKILRVGMKDERVIALRKRLGIAGDKNNPLYDETVRAAVTKFQEQADIGVDGNVGPATVRALNGGSSSGPATHRSLAAKIDTVVVNMERWRWFPRDLGNPHVIVNVPDYTLTLWNDGKVYWKTKIVAGAPGTHATPMISAEMKFITVNPTWNVPPSIIEKEYLPALEQDPTALERIGLKVEQAPDGTVRIYQPPGAGNALGRIRFNFPNKFLVYQHDTPDKYLFAKEKRAYSHGCMRVQNPLTYGEKLLSLTLPQDHYTEAKLERMFGGNEININFPKPIWVHLTYQTAFVDADGKLQFRDDVYGRDAKMISILKGSERKVADIPVERAPNTSAKPVRMPVGMFGGERDSGPNFFDWLFNGGRSQQSDRQQRGFIGPRAGVNGRYSYR